MSDEMKACANTDRELWRETEGDYYSPSIHVTEGGGIGIDVGGTVIVKPLREWHRAAIEDTTVKGDGLVGWQPIETAPKDGQPFLAWADGYEWPEVIQWFDFTDDERAETGLMGYFHFADATFQDIAPEFDAGELTHWMPLPAAPGEDTPEAADTITTLKGEIKRRDERIAEIEAALRAIEQTAFIGSTTDSDETLHVAVESAHDIARQALGSTENVG